MSHASNSALLLVDQAGVENVSVQHDLILLKDLLQAVCLTRGTHVGKRIAPDTSIAQSLRVTCDTSKSLPEF